MKNLWYFPICEGKGFKQIKIIWMSNWHRFSSLHTSAGWIYMLPSNQVSSLDSVLRNIQSSSQAELPTHRRKASSDLNPTAQLPSLNSYTKVVLKGYKRPLGYHWALHWVKQKFKNIWNLDCVTVTFRICTLPRDSCDRPEPYVLGTTRSSTEIYSLSSLEWYSSPVTIAE